MGKTRKKTIQTGKSGLAVNAAKGAALGFGVSLVLLLVVAALLLGGLFSEALADSLILVCVLVGATVGGLYCAGKQGGGVVVAGLCAAGFYVLFILLGTLLFKRTDIKGGPQELLTVKVLIASVAGGCFGGVLKLNRKRKKSKLRRK